MNAEKNDHAHVFSIFYQEIIGIFFPSFVKIQDFSFLLSAYMIPNILGKSNPHFDKIVNF